MYEAKITSNGNERYHAITRHAEFDMATNGTGASPTDVLLASLCACVGHYVGAFLAQQKVPAVDYEVSADAELTEERSRLAEIHVTLDVRNAALSEAAQSELLRFITQCQIHNTLKSNSRISICVRTSEAA